MSITLNWVGPYRFGRFGELRQYPYADQPHVYVRVQTFRSRKIAAVGKATSLSCRMNEHIRDFLSRQYSLSDENRTHHYKPVGGAAGEGLGVFDFIDEWLDLAVAEVKRFSFFAAPCDEDKLGYVEAELIDRLWNAAENSGGRIERDHWKRETKLPSGELTLKYQFANPEARGVVDFIPDTPVTGSEKSVEIASATPSLEPGVYTYSAPGMPMCPDCGERPAIFYCSIHQSAVCLECVAKHDKRGECVYLPAYRAPKPTTGQIAPSEPATPTTGGRPRSILGIG